MGKVTAVTILDNEQFLRQISQEVQEFDENLLEEIKILEDYCKENEVMAMSLVQLGIPKRIIYLKNTNLDLINKLQENKETDKDYNEQRILINPRIVSREGITSYYEACASCLDNLGLVRRPYKIEVCYQDLNQLEHQETFLGFESTVLSHEMDHLDGILHIDIADEILVMDVESRKKFRQKNGYQIISKTGNYEELLKTKEVRVKK